MFSAVTSPDFKIVDETAEYIVVDKPAFLLTHPIKPTQRTTLWKELSEILAFEIANGGQVSIVNRLDRETSGLVLVAKTAAAARRFGLLMQEHRLHKEYLAIVWGWPEWETEIVDAPLDRQGKHQASAIWLKQMIHPDGAPAQTRFVCISPRSTARSSATKSTDLMRSSISNLSRPVGLRSSNTSYSYRVTLFIRPSSRSRMGSNGRAHRRLKCLRRSLR